MVNLPILIPTIAGCITVFGLVVMAACLFAVEPSPIRRRRR